MLPRVVVFDEMAPKSYVEKAFADMVEIRQEYAERVRLLVEHLANYSTLDIDGMCASACMISLPLTQSQRSHSAWQALAWWKYFGPMEGAYLNEQRLLASCVLDADALYCYGVFCAHPSGVIYRQLKKLSPSVWEHYVRHCTNVAVSEALGVPLRGLGYDAAAAYTIAEQLDPPPSLNDAKRINTRLS